MICQTLNRLYQLCQANKVAFSPSDMVRLACGTCATTEVCPAISDDEYEARNSPRLTGSENVKQ